tara:strand:+ start:11028 stop:11804 length:777 start_codon:yes stop_codon:yes gene_type:complete
MSVKWQTVWITGASSGIGNHFAKLIASEAEYIAVSARREESLISLSKEYKNIHAFPLDVSNLINVKNAAKKILNSSPNGLDLVILNAGVSKLFTTDKIENRYQDIIDSMNINYFGVLNCINAVLPDMIKRRKGHIVINGSLAGYRGLPNSIAYSPTKAALINLAEILKSELFAYNIKVTIINPGFVETEATNVNNFKMPAIVSVDYAAKKIIKGIKDSKYEVSFPFYFSLVFKFIRIIPNPLYFSLIRRFVWNRKKDL